MMKKTAANLLLFFAALLFSLLVSELFIRVFYLSPAPAPEHHQLFMEHDPLLGWRQIPNNTGKHITSEYAISEGMNSRGIRGPEYLLEKRRDEYRILVLGDSFAEGYTVEFHELFSEVLKHQLNEQKRDRYYEVINTGTGGYSTDQELLLFKNEGKKYTPDLTIVLFYENDVWFNNQPQYRRRPKPLFQFNDDGTLRLTNVPIPKPNRPPKSPRRKSQSWKTPGKAAHAWLSEKSHLYRFILDRTKNTASIRSLAIKIGLSNDRDKAANSLVPIPNEFRVLQKQHDTDIAEAWRVTEALLVRLQKEAASIRSQFLIVNVPSRTAIYLEYWERMKKRYGIAEDHWTIDKVRHDLMAICQRQTFDCLDLTETFRAKVNRHEPAGKLLYFIHDGHWTAEGHRLAGEILGQYISRTYLLPMN